MKKGIIFDMDGTLWDSAENVAVSWNLVIKESGLIEKKLTTEDIQGVMGKTMDVIGDILFGELEKETRMHLMDDCCRRENDYLREHGGMLYEGVEEVFGRLKERGYHLLIVSNCQAGYIEAFLDYYKLWDYIDDTLCYGDNLRGKGENIRIAAERNGLDAAVYVGDIQGDYDASVQAGAGFLHAAYGFGTIRQEVPAIHSLRELAEYDVDAYLRGTGKRTTYVKRFGMEGNMTKLDELQKVISREHVYIQTHNFPDPDAIASAFGLQYLLEQRGIRSSICYRGKIDRYSTQKLREIMGIRLFDTDEMASGITDEDEVILVDAQRGNSNIAMIPGKVIACIDHHPDNDHCEYPFEDIRSEVGACASIIGGYFIENEVPVNEQIATALTFGIRIDTSNLSRGVSKLDLEIIYKMYDQCDYGTIHMLENSNLCFDDLIGYAEAISSIEVYDDVSFADSGRDCPVISSISDFMLALKEVVFSVVYGRKENGINLSVRSEKPELHAGKIVDEALAGIGSGGGHASMAGGFIPFTGSDREEAVLLDEVKERFMSVLGVKRENGRW